MFKVSLELKVSVTYAIAGNILILGRYQDDFEGGHYSNGCLHPMPECPVSVSTWYSSFQLPAYADLGKQ